MPRRDILFTKWTEVETDMGVTLQFCGAAQTVTGSCYLIKTPECNFLVDCGMFQGPKTLKELNYRDFPFDPAGIDFVLQTHAHIDHAGLLPKLTKAGFKGKILATEGTRDLLTFMLPDSGFIQEMEVRHLNQRNARRGKPEVTPIYTQQDAQDCLRFIAPVEYETWVEAGTGVRARFWNAGHILGSASIEIEITSPRTDAEPLRILFSGDIGPDNKLFEPDPDAPSHFDYVVTESTYGNRSRPQMPPEDRRRTFAKVVNDALQGGGKLIIPAFAVERSQELIVDLLYLQDTGEIPDVPIFLDSPLAIRITRVFEKHAQDLEDLTERPKLLTQSSVRPTVTVDESKEIANYGGSAIILAASGMCEAGRIRHHLKRWLWETNATVLFAGYQAPGTLGRLLLDGARNVKIQGDEIQLMAKIRKIDVYSGHADREELLDWIKERQPVSSALFLTHGDEEKIAGLKAALAKSGFDETRIYAPALDDEVELRGSGNPPKFYQTQPRLPSEASIKLDWHNDLAQFTFDMREAFEQAADDKARAKFIRKLRRALED